MGLGTLGKAGLVGAVVGVLLFGAYAARKGESAVLDGEMPGKQYALDILTHGAKGGLILGGLGVLRALRRGNQGRQETPPLTPVAASCFADAFARPAQKTIQDNIQVLVNPQISAYAKQDALKDGLGTSCFSYPCPSTVEARTIRLGVAVWVWDCRLGFLMVLKRNFPA